VGGLEQDAWAEQPNAKEIVMKKLLIVVAAMLWVAAAHGEEKINPVPIAVPTTDNAVIAEILNVRPVVPIGPYDLLRDYERQMNGISQQLGEELRAIMDAVQREDIAPAVGDYFSEHRFQLAMMKFQLLSVLHANLVKSIQDAESADDRSDDAQGAADDRGREPHVDARRIAERYGPPVSSGPDRR
jgi:hypothetical protein